jgi:nucleotide-binding universal stress UspA family protein
MSHETSSERAPIRHVVAATDFSEPAAVGVAWARDVARVHGATLHLVHALYPIEPGLVGLVPPFDLTEEAMRSVRERLEQLAAELSAEGVPTLYRVDFGLPSQVIQRVAGEERAELVVLATRGLGGFQHLLLGSTAERVVQKAEQPVLSVHATDGAAAKPVRHVLLATDFSEDARLAREAALRVFRLGEGSRIHLLHVFHLPPEYQVDRAEGLSAMSRSFRDRATAGLVRELDGVALELGARGWTVETEVAEGYPPEVIVSRAAELGVDLVAMGTHGRSPLGRVFLGSVARRVVQHAPCPVLTVRSAA